MTRSEYIKQARQCITWAYAARRGGYSPRLYLQAARNWIACAQFARIGGRS